jgi:hypothetical protein
MTSPLVHWQDGRIVDDVPRLARPWAAVAGALGVLVAVDLALALALPPREGPPVELDGAAAAGAELDRAAASDGAPWLLIGDSVLAGDVMAGRVEDWTRQRVVDHLRRDAAGEARFFQVALDGLLPVDALRLVRELDRRDPGGRVGVVLEVNPRYFSPRHAGSDECTRAWLCELGAPLAAPGGPVRWDSFVWDGLHDLRDAVARVTPVLRLQDRLAPRGLDPAALLRRAPSAASALEARARLLEHYRGVVVDESSAQWRAFAELVDRLRAHGRRAVVFTTPVEDEFHAQAATPEERGALAAALSRRVERAGDDGRVRLVHLDHPGFAAPLFLDHCHLGAEGNRMLARNLLHALGEPLADVPPPGELVDEEGPERSLVARAALGQVDGPPWLAQLRQADGVAVAPGGRRVVIADRGAHTLRELAGDLTTLRTLAGAAGQRGAADGPLASARLASPSAPTIVGERVYFADQSGSALRLIEGAQVRTLKVASGPAWRSLRKIRAVGDELLLLDDGRQVLRYAPATGRSEPLVRAAGVDLRAMATAPDGRLFLADARGRVWAGRVDVPATLGPDAATGAEVLLDGTGELAIPQESGHYFPLTFDEFRLLGPRELEYVARYDALLVLDEHPAKSGADRDFDERAHLRLLGLADRRVYPWIRPLAYGGGHMFLHAESKTFGSSVHVGSLALEPRSAAVVLVERGRSRVQWLGDGMLALGKTSHIVGLRRAGFQDPFGAQAGATAQRTFRPDLWLTTRPERAPRRGPFTALLINSSMSAMAQDLGQYSIGRLLERHLGGWLGARDAARFDLWQRTISGPSLAELVTGVEDFVRDRARPDVILVEVQDFHGHMFKDVARADMQRALDRLTRAAARHDSLLVLWENQGIVTERHDGLRASPPQVTEFLELGLRAGAAVIPLTDELLRTRAGEIGVWASLPLGAKSFHGSVMTIDATALALAERVYPHVRAHLLRPGRRPSLFSRAAGGAPAGLRAVFEQHPAELPALPPQAVLHAEADGRLEVFVDLARAPDVPKDMSEAQARDLALAALRRAVVEDGAQAPRAVVRLARFTRYDEYGLGVGEGAEVAYELVVDRATLAALLGG